MEKKTSPSCSTCSVKERICLSETGKGPPACPTVTMEEKILKDHFEVMCNPIAQAEILNQTATDFNIMMGLCVGHDALFLKHVSAYTTVFAAKDRVLGHNPMAALYLSKSYYRRLCQKSSDT